MTFDEYQQAAHATAIYPEDREREYLSLGLISEVGELAGKLKKEIRDGVDLTEAIIDEASDCCWYASQICLSYGERMVPAWKIGQGWQSDWNTEDQCVRGIANFAAMLCSHYAERFNKWAMNHMLMRLEWLVENRGYSLENVMARNIAKLQSRQQRNALGGSGDNR
jgi:NTP pyrophosphatase (non-canonical NTP hydrolase)